MTSTASEATKSFYVKKWCAKTPNESAQYRTFRFDFKPISQSTFEKYLPNKTNVAAANNKQGTYSGWMKRNGTTSLNFYYGTNGVDGANSQTTYLSVGSTRQKPTDTISVGYTYT